LQTFLHLNPAAVLSHLSARTGKIEISSTLSAITTQYSGFHRQIFADLHFENNRKFLQQAQKLKKWSYQICFVLIQPTDYTKQKEYPHLVFTFNHFFSAGKTWGKSEN